MSISRSCDTHFLVLRQSVNNACRDVTVDFIAQVILLPLTPRTVFYSFAQLSHLLLSRFPIFLKGNNDDKVTSLIQPITASTCSGKDFWNEYPGSRKMVVVECCCVFLSDDIKPFRPHSTKAGLDSPFFF